MAIDTPRDAVRAVIDRPVLWPGTRGAVRRMRRDGACRSTDGVNYRVDEASHTAFCLVDVPDADTAVTVHRQAHGLVPDKIYRVVEGD